MIDKLKSIYEKMVNGDTSDATCDLSDLIKDQTGGETYDIDANEWWDEEVLLALYEAKRKDSEQASGEAVAPSPTDEPTAPEEPQETQAEKLAKLCNSCINNPSMPMHKCPFAVAMGQRQKPCDCCPECQADCKEDIDLDE